MVEQEAWGMGEKSAYVQERPSSERKRQKPEVDFIQVWGIVEHPIWKKRWFQQQSALRQAAGIVNGNLP